MNSFVAVSTIARRLISSKGRFFIVASIRLVSLSIKKTPVAFLNLKRDFDDYVNSSRIGHRIAGSDNSVVAERRVLLSWSSGKDSAWTLHQLRVDPGNRLEALLTTVTREFDGVSMHGVRNPSLSKPARPYRGEDSFSPTSSSLIAEGRGLSWPAWPRASRSNKALIKTKTVT